MFTLGIETTAHTLSIGVEENGKILSNVIDMYRVGSEGMIPRKLADHHAEVFSAVLEKALKDAKISMDGIDLIAVSEGPGIGAPLSLGISGAKYLASKFDKKLIGVNHGYAHAKISEHFCKMKKPLVLYVSGGNSQILVEGKEDKFYSVIGETLDLGLGNMFDSFARAIKMEHAHGSALAKLAEGGKYVDLPYSVKGLNLVFSGLQTAAEKAAQSHPHKDVAFSLMETAFTMICEVTERALFLTKKKELVVCGGVAQNRQLQGMLKKMCEEDDVRFGVAPDEFNRDNGAMIAYTGSLLFKKYGPMRVERLKPITNYRIEKMQEIFSTK